jgi:hypothetical protein
VRGLGVSEAGIPGRTGMPALRVRRVKPTRWREQRRAALDCMHDFLQVNFSYLTALQDSVAYFTSVSLGLREAQDPEKVKS